MLKFWISMCICLTVIIIFNLGEAATTVPDELSSPASSLPGEMSSPASPLVGKRPLPASPLPGELLLEALFSNYRPEVVPQSAYTHNVRVWTYFFLSTIHTLNERDQILTVSGYLNLNWTDPRLQWDPIDYGGQWEIVVPDSMVWRPELVLDNSLDENIDLSLDARFRVKVLHYGVVVWPLKLRIATICKVDLLRFPFDRQTCFINFTSLIYGEVLDYSMTHDMFPFDFFYYNNSQWHLDMVKTGDALIETFPGYMITQLYIRISLSRKPGYYISHVLSPAVMIALVSGMVFYLPPESGEKISLAITVSLSYTVLLLMLSDTVPRSGDSLPIISYYIILSMLLTFVSLISTVFILNLYHHSAHSRLPTCCRSFIHCLGRVVCLPTPFSCRVKPTRSSPSLLLEDMEQQDSPKTPQKTVSYPGSRLEEAVCAYMKRKQEDVREKEVSELYREEWILAAKVLDRCMLFGFILTSFVFLVVFMDQLKDDDTKG